MKGLIGKNNQLSQIVKLYQFNLSRISKTTYLNSFFYSRADGGISTTVQWYFTLEEVAS